LRRWSCNFYLFSFVYFLIHFYSFIFIIIIFQFFASFLSCFFCVVLTCCRCF
jgi:hypothetical protein